MKLTWSSPVTLATIILHDRPNANDQITSATLTFSNGTPVAVGALPNDGSGLTVNGAQYQHHQPDADREFRQREHPERGPGGDRGMDPRHRRGGNQPPIANAGPAQIGEHGGDGDPGRLGKLGPERELADLPVDPDGRPGGDPVQRDGGQADVHRPGQRQPA